MKRRWPRRSMPRQTSPPPWGRGLKQALANAIRTQTASPPPWGRGLKHCRLNLDIVCRSRPPRGGVD